MKNNDSKNLEEASRAKYIGVWLLAAFLANLVSYALDFVFEAVNPAETIIQFINQSSIGTFIAIVSFSLVYLFFPSINTRVVLPWFLFFGAIGSIIVFDQARATAELFISTFSDAEGMIISDFTMPFMLATLTGIGVTALIFYYRGWSDVWNPKKNDKKVENSSEVDDEIKVESKNLISDDGLSGSRSKAFMAIRFRPEVSSAWEKVKSLDKDMQEKFLNSLNENPKMDAGDLAAKLVNEYEISQNPYERKELNEILREVRKIGSEAENEFHEVIATLGEDVDPEILMSHIRGKYE